MEKERVALSDGSSKVQRPSKMIAKPKTFDLIRECVCSLARDRAMIGAFEKSVRSHT